jgi:hypothetical protein
VPREFDWHHGLARVAAFNLFVVVIDPEYHVIPQHLADVLRERLLLVKCLFVARWYAIEGGGSREQYDGSRSGEQPPRHELIQHGSGVVHVKGGGDESKVRSDREEQAERVQARRELCGEAEEREGPGEESEQHDDGMNGRVEDSVVAIRVPSEVAVVLQGRQEKAQLGAQPREQMQPARRRVEDGEREHCSGSVEREEEEGGHELNSIAALVLAWDVAKDGWFARSPDPPLIEVSIGERHDRASGREGRDEGDVLQPGAAAGRREPEPDELDQALRYALEAEGEKKKREEKRRRFEAIGMEEKRGEA